MAEPRVGLLAEFATPAALVAAARQLAAEGGARMEAYTPYPLHELDDVLRLPRSPVARRTFFAGLTWTRFRRGNTRPAPVITPKSQLRCDLTARFVVSASDLGDGQR